MRIRLSDYHSRVEGVWEETLFPEIAFGRMSSILTQTEPSNYVTLIPITAERCTQNSAESLNNLHRILDNAQGVDVCRCPP
jgi:hypothetical protein